MTTVRRDTISATLFREDASEMAGLLGGLTAGCGLDGREAAEVLAAWSKALTSRFGKDPQGRLPLEDYRDLFSIFCDHVRNVLTREGLTR